MPTGHIKPSSWLTNRDLAFADPCWNEPGPIDMLLSVDVFASSLRPGLIQGDPGQPTVIKTIFGWIVMGGGALDISRPRRGSCHVTTKITENLSLDDSIRRFWELEDVHTPTNVLLSKNDALCEQHFATNYRRTEEGRYIVPLPFADLTSKPIFNGSRAIALKRFSLLEKKLQLNSELSKSYAAFMKDYEACGHLERCDPPANDSGNFFYIPHHGILRLSSTSTPLRVVFDASARDARGISLNDTLLAGPKLQKNIFHLLLRFRWHAVVFTADVKQMYRQILVFPEDAEYQRILWRPSPREPIGDYRLLTVTYGVSSAPFQALRTIEQLAQDLENSHPDGSGVLKRDTYVDDIVTGADSVEQATRIRSELTRILASGGFHLRKWTSNRPDFFVGVPPEDLYCEKFREFESIDDMALKILGLSWLPQPDCFTFKVSVDDRRCTKRTILSEIARIFDPLGLLSPLTFFAKYLMQLLWVSGVAWDDDAPDNISLEWKAFRAQLPVLSSVNVPRRMVSDFVVLQLHGFCDASERGMCAVIYCRMLDANGVCTVKLSCAKSKVAPLRKLSIPRLELLAAVLLADLMTSVQEALKPFHVVQDTFAWSDSSVALSWIKSCPSRWKTFVANRVSHIQDTIPPESWRHVRTADNPADCGSRGLLPNDLINQTSWWHGPYWLSQPADAWPRSAFSVDTDSYLGEQKLVTLVAHSSEETPFVILLNKFSSLKTLNRVVAYCLRYIHNLKHRLSKNKVITGPITPAEVTRALMALIKFSQMNYFSSEIELLKAHKFNSLPKTFKKLSPFVDDAGLLRVGGRLSRASVDFDIKHPLLLPRDDRLTVLLIEEYHQKFMHPGVQTLQNLLAKNFWILSPKRAIRAVVSKCLKCFRVRPTSASAPFMGDLPSYRINALKPFLSAAVDYGGPFDVSLGRGRGNKTYKAYICVFVCTATKAVHAELATELTTEAFLAALRRFVARRGHCRRLVSDQGKNFVGASNILKRLTQDAAHTSEIRFEFNPPGSPHFSGLAESGIKAFKTHLSRVVGQQRLTYEEFYTVLTQVEALLNSRPLTPLSADPNDLSALTPGHFLTTEPLSLVPDESLTDVQVSIQHRWKLLQKMHQDFWARWSQEYMHTLQQRTKWHDRQVALEKGALVLVLNEQTSPMKWPLGRIVDTHPGADGIVRVVTVRTACGLYKRPVVKLCPLPT
ncbi:uncharacterized protein [Choristoneura fumiferana]|uniref:uncharacterized protein n=1 Tax=Choristoneura fumiferana TaxID=7141 RepID=UPI003D153AD1